MKLTGQALADFEKWYHLVFSKDDPKNKVTHKRFTRYFFNNTDSEQWGVLQDFSDSKGYCIQIETLYINKTHPTYIHTRSNHIIV